MKKWAKDSIKYVAKKKENIRKCTTSQENYEAKKYNLARLNKKIKVNIND